MTTLGVIGLGRIGAFHTETLSALDGLDGLVITDERTDVAAAVAAKHGVKAVDTVEELLSSGIDGVVVAAATPAHAELTLAAVERGIPTFCEKPIASTALESARVAETIARTGVPVQVGYQRRFDAAFAAAKRAVDDGSLGTLHTVRSTTMDPAPPPLDYIKGSGGIFRDCAVHDFDIIRWITGQNAVEVYATGSVQGDPLFAEYGDVDTAAVVVRFDGGALGRRCRMPATTPADTTAALRFTGSTTAWPPAGIRVCRCEMSTRPTHSRPDPRTISSWTASPKRSARAGRLRGGGQGRAGRRRHGGRRRRGGLAGRGRHRVPAPGHPGAHRGGSQRMSANIKTGGQERCDRGIKIAGAPISWGVCEVPGWGHQLDPERVLTEMRDTGLTATELGPEGFLPADTAELQSVLTRHGLACVGGFVPVVLHNAGHDPADDLAGPLDSLVAAGAGVVVLAAATGSDGYDSRPVLDDDQWATLLSNLDRLASIVAAARPACGAASARRQPWSETRERCGPSAGRLDDPALSGHRPSADRRHRPTRAGQGRPAPHQAHSSEGRGRCVGRQGAVR